MNCSVVRETWTHGNVSVGTLTDASAMYLSGYVSKKMVRFDDPRLSGRHPEFARMSLRPGIGAHAMHDVASEMLRFGLEKRSVPLALRHGRNELPLGRYLRKKLKEYSGAEDHDEWKESAAAQLRLVREFAFNNSRSVASVFKELNEERASRLAQKLKAKSKGAL